MKKQQLQSLQLNKKTISSMKQMEIKGRGWSAFSDCMSICLGLGCPDER
jgi:hypothetical protein